MRPHVEAIRRGDLAALRAALKRDPALAKKPQLIHEAARAARLDAIDLLLRAGADPGSSWRGYRPLHSVIQEEPHAAAKTPSAERRRCVDRLLKAGADPEQLGAFPPARAILIAAFTGIPAYVEALRTHGARVDGFVSASTGDAAAVARALKQDRAFARARDDGGMTALQCCAASRLGRSDASVRDGLLAAAARLLDAGADPNARVKAWSHEVDVAYFAASSRQLELFGLLLERGADATAALTPAVWNATFDFAELALRAGADVNAAESDGRPLLNDLIRWGQLRPALWVLERGASPNARDARGWTAVHQAASRGNLAMLDAVLRAGGDARRKDAAGKSPFDVARAAGRAPILDRLVEARKA